MTLSRPRRRRAGLVAVAAVAAATTALAGCAPGYARLDSPAGEVAAAAECDRHSFRLSHQWPAPTGEDSDFRAQLAEDFANAVEEASDGEISIQVFPSNTLAAATEQYDAMQVGSIDGSVFPLDYASGHVPEWGITLMPGLVRNHEAARAFNEGEIGQAIEQSMLDNGLVLLTNVWNAGGIGTQSEPIIAPDDMPPGTTMRAAGRYVELMLEESGAGITSLPSSEIYSAMQTGILDATITSASSFASYNLHEQVVSYTSPTENTFWFMYQPLVLSVTAFEQLCAEQQELVRQVGDDLQEQAYADSVADDERVERLFDEAGVDVYHMDDDAYAQWLELAENQWDAFVEEVPSGQRLLDLALQIEEDRR